MKTLFFAAVLTLAAGTALGQMPECGAVPGWQQQGPNRSYAPDNLFDYMDGNAEGYLIYRFAEMKGITCKNGDDTILIDISDMTNPEFAYGIFSANRDPKLPLEPIGMGGQAGERRATFAKGKYYVELAANPAKDHSAALRAYVGVIEKRIEGRTTPPEAISWFPKDKLIPDSVRLIPQSVLGLGILRSGYVGQYEFGKGFVVPEESPAAAAQVIEKLKQRLTGVTPVPIAEEGFKGTDKYLDGLYVFRKGRYIGGFANLKSGIDAAAEASALAANVK